MTHTLLLEASDLPTKHVTVYGDRAEVNKVIKVHLKQGANEVRVGKLSRSLDSDSIRVEGYGRAVISEVKYQEKKVTKDEEIKEKEKELHHKIKKLKEDRKNIEQNFDRFKKQREVLDGIANQLGQTGTNCDKNKENRPSAYTLICDENGLQNVEKFFEYYERRSAEFDHKLNDLADRLEKINEEINVADSSLSDVFRTGCAHAREVTIFVTSAEDHEAILDLFYVVSNVSWKPSYDIRVQTEETAMKVIYYGLIEQDTDEDWNDVKLTLSTATPRIGGQVPEIGTTKVSFYKPPPPRMVPTALTARAAPRVGGFGGAAMETSTFFDEMRLQSAAPKMSYTEAKVKENVSSTTFEIENPTTIPSDNSLHKVTIAIIDLQPTFEYEVIPSKSLHTYFKAKTSNTSQYPLLSGPTAIFVGQSFVANGSMKSVNPTENFDVSLGIDSSIKVDYKAAKKFNDESGILTKSSLLTHEQKIGLHNTKAEVIRVIVIEPLPLSTEEKLKVVLLEPVVSKNSDKAVHFSLNKRNNIEWQISLQASEKKELVLKYQIEYPKGEQLECNEED